MHSKVSQRAQNHWEWRCVWLQHFRWRHASSGECVDCFKFQLSVYYHKRVIFRDFLLQWRASYNICHYTPPRMVWMNNSSLTGTQWLHPGSPDPHTINVDTYNDHVHRVRQVILFVQVSLSGPVSNINSKETMMTLFCDRFSFMIYLECCNCCF